VVDEPARNRVVANLATGTVLFALSRGISMQQISEATGVSAEQIATRDWLPQHVVPRVWLLLAAHSPDQAIALDMARTVAIGNTAPPIRRRSRRAPDLHPNRCQAT
jgi:hypothetical protein